MTGAEASEVDTSLFDAAGLVTAITEESCTLSNGATSTCLRIEINAAPSNHEAGPWCPTNISDSADDGGLWFVDGTVYDVDGAFIENLQTFYANTVSDPDVDWLLYDKTTGKVNVTDTQESCAAAAVVDVSPEYYNYCVECQLDYLTDGKFPTTITIPKVPVARAAPQEIAGMGVVGVSFNGVAFDPPAPYDIIVGAYGVAPFDDCGGHINLNAGYHYHGATGCGSSVPTCDDHGSLIGYARDGYAMYSQTDAAGDEPADLDGCRGHTDATRGYHYHVASAGENLFIGCFHGEVVDDGPGGGGGVETCEPGQTAMCCGDGTCDGPETAANCSADCS